MPSAPTANDRPHSPDALLQEIAPDVFWFHPPSGGEVYLVRTGEGLVLIDSGFAHFTPVLRAAMQTAGLPADTLRLAFATHQHCDHAGGLGGWQREFGIPVIAHALDADAIESGDSLKTAAEIVYTAHQTEFIPCPIARRVAGGETISLGEQTFTIVHTPGHTPGSMGIRCGELLFSGDVIFENGGIGWVDVHWGSNPEDMIATLDAFRAEVGTRLCPGHGAPFILSTAIRQTAHDTAAFYLPTAHGYGSPRADRASKG